MSRDLAPGCCRSAPLLRQHVHRADRLRRSLEASPPQRMLNGASAWAPCGGSERCGTKARAKAPLLAFRRALVVGSPGVEAWPLACAASGIKGSHDISLWARASTPYIRGMTMPLYEKCGRRNLITYHVEPKESWRVPVNDRWKSICPSCIDAEAEPTLCAISLLVRARYRGAILLHAKKTWKKRR